MVTVNLSATLVTALVAYTYRATVSAFGIVLFVVFFPRCMVRIGNARQLSRRERIWLHAAPLVLRLWLLSAGILGWFMTRTAHDFLAYLSLMVALASAISFFITITPFVKSNGYHLIAAFLNEPHLRGKSLKALLNKFRKNVYRKADNNVLVAYALVSMLYMVTLGAAMLYLLSRFLEIYIGKTSIAVIALLALVLIWRMIAKFKEIDRNYEQSVQFERWRKRTLPQIDTETAQKVRPNRALRYLTRSIFLLVLAAMFLPYKYEPGGNFIIMPNEQQTITAEIAGIIEKINFDGGEMLKTGTVIGQLSYSDYLAQVKIYDAKIQEQQAVINELKAKPKPEEVQLAQTALDTQETQVQFSKGKAERLEVLYKEGVVSFEELDDARRKYQVDLDQISEKRANLELVKSGATPDELAAAEAKLQSYQEERDYNKEKIEQSILHMPFDGKLITMHLKQKVGSYLNKGEPLAVVEKIDQVIVEIEVPETDISYVKEKASVRVRPSVYHDEDFYGVVTLIDSNVTEERSGKVVKVITLLENPHERLKSGMTGYAKIAGEAMPVWKVASLAIIRFIKVEVWSWLP
jgi:putative peptide zinc metalloprotease protein